MVAGLTYAQYVTELATLAVVEPANVDYLQNLPSAIDWAELAIYRDLDLLSTVSSLTGSLTAFNRTLAIGATAGLVTLQQINIITPAGTTDPDQGTRNPCLPTTKERLDIEWGSGATGAAGLPTLFAPFNQTQSNNTTVYFGRWPDAAYTAEVIGTIRPASLSASNVTTWISLNLPDLLLAASLIFISGFQRNFGRASDDPQMAVSWQQQYDKHLATAVVEEQRKKFQGPGWTSMSPSPVASPTRG